MKQLVLYFDKAQIGRLGLEVSVRKSVPEPDHDAQVEALADLIHEQWMEWAQNLMDKEDLSPDRVERWKGYMVPYSELTEEVKEEDRKWARKYMKRLARVQ